MILKIVHRLEISCELKKAILHLLFSFKITFTVFVTLCLLCFVCSAFRGWRCVCKKYWDVELSLASYRSCSRSTSNTAGALWYVGPGILTIAGGLTSALSQGKNAQKLEGGCWGQALQPHVLRCCTCSRASPWIACGRGSAAPVQNCTQESAAQDCALLAQPPHCTWVIVHRYNWDVVGWVVWVRFQSGASVKGNCVS